MENDSKTKGIIIIRQTPWGKAFKTGPFNEKQAREQLKDVDEVYPQIATTTAADVEVLHSEGDGSEN